jgi:hypothetical protein
MPSACRQAFEESVLGRRLIRMKGLWIELSRKRLDLRFVNRVGRAREALPDTEVIQIKTIRHGVTHGLPPSLVPFSTGD